MTYRLQRRQVGGTLAHAIAVRRQLRAIFDYRRFHIAESFPYRPSAGHGG